MRLQRQEFVIGADFDFECDGSLESPLRKLGEGSAERGSFFLKNAGNCGDTGGDSGKDIGDLEQGRVMSGD